MFFSFQNIEQRLKIIAYFITIAGALPFVASFIIIIFSKHYNFIFYSILIYSGLIICFVCGSNWVIILSSANLIKKINFNYYLIFIFNSIFPIVLAWLIIINEKLNSDKYSLYYLGILLILLLLFDMLFYYRKMIEYWWLRLRILGSLLSGFSLIGYNIIMI